MYLQTGFIFNSSHFSDTSDSWGVSFTIWSDTPNDIKNNFEHVIYENEDSFELVENGIQILYNCDNRKKANYFFSKKEKNDIKLPPINSFLTISRCFSVLAKIALSSTISDIKASYSSLIFWRSSAAIRRNCISKIAFA